MTFNTLCSFLLLFLFFIFEGAIFIIFIYFNVVVMDNKLIYIINIENKILFKKLSIKYEAN